MEQEFAISFRSVDGRSDHFDIHSAEHGYAGPQAVDGELMREECYGLFTDPRMLKAFKKWSTRRQ